MATHRQLPLFPLNTVLFPGNDMPLQIFEPRYRQMLKDCMDGDSRFGVVLIKAGVEVGGRAVTHAVGTIARIIQVNEIGEGRFFVSAQGERRFRLVARHEDDPYPTGEVEPIVEQPGEGDLGPIAGKVRESARELLNLVVGLGGGWAGRRALPDAPEPLSYYVPKLLRIELADRQRLLEAVTTSERLSAEAELLETQIDALKSRVSSELRGRFSAN